MNIVNKPTISVIMSVRNNISTIDFAVLSILRQTFSDFEFIICDDASSDGTFEKLSRYAEKDRRIILFRNRINKGIKDSLNECIALVKGTYCARMDGDDISDLSRFEKQVAFLQKNTGCSFCGTSAYLFNERFDVFGQYSVPISPTKNQVYNCHPFIHPSIMFRTAVIASVHGYLPEKRISRAEDYNLWCYLASLGLMGRNLPETLYFYRESSSSPSKRSKKYRLRYLGLKTKWFFRIGYFHGKIFGYLKSVFVLFVPERLIFRRHVRQVSKNMSIADKDIASKKLAFLIDSMSVS